MCLYYRLFRPVGTLPLFQVNIIVRAPDGNHMIMLVNSGDIKPAGPPYDSPGSGGLLNFAFQRLGDYFRFRVNVQLPVNVSYMGTHGVNGNIIAVGNHFVTRSVYKPVNDVMLSRGQIRFRIFFGSFLLELSDHLARNLWRHGRAPARQL